MRIATPADAPALAVNVADGFASYRDWAPAGWASPAIGAAEIARVADRLGQPEVWSLLALDGEDVAGHIGLAPTTREDPEPAPPGTTNVWQLFLREPWRGRGVAASLMARAVAEAAARGIETMRLWTPQGAGRARRFYEREGWRLTGEIHERTPIGLVTVQYARAVRGGL